MRDERFLFRILVLAVLLLLAITGVLAYRFFGMLSEDSVRLKVTERLAQARGGADTADSPGSARELPNFVGLDTVIGANGAARKFSLKTPVYRPPVGTPAPAEVAEEGTSLAAEQLGQLPLAFDVKCPGTCTEFEFGARGAGFEVFGGGGDITLVLHRPELEPLDEGPITCTLRGKDISSADLSPDVTLRLRLLGANPDATLAGNEKSANRNNYLVGADPKRWLTDITTYASVQYLDIYPGVDLSYYGNQDRLEYVLLVRPGAEAGDIRLTYEGAENTRIDEQGNLHIEFEGGGIIQRAPAVYQIINDVAYPVSGGYVADGTDIGFELAPYDQTSPLFIKPSLDLASYLGGVGRDRGYAVAVDGQGYGYISGETTSSEFFRRGADAETGDHVSTFVTKFRLRDSEPVYTTSIGGRGDDRGFALTTDANGAVYLCGETLSPDFPATLRARSAGPGETWDAFVVRLSPSGADIDFALCLGGSADDRAYGVALDSATNILLAGETTSPDFPVTGQVPGTTKAKGRSAFLAKISTVDPRILYAAPFGGSGQDTAFGLAVDAHDCAYVVGETSSRDLPVTDHYHAAHGGGAWDAFVAKFTPSCDRLVFATYLGGTNDDRAYSVAVDSASHVYVAGETASGDFPTTNAAQPAYAGGNWDAFVTKLMPTGRGLVYSTYLGGSGNDRAFAVAADASGKASVAGTTTSTNLPVRDAFQAGHGGGEWDAFVARLRAGGALSLVSYLGGTGNDSLYAVAVDPRGAATLAGTTSATNVPMRNPIQSNHSGGEEDALVAKVPPESNLGPELKLVPAGGQPNGPDYDFYMSKYEATNEEFVQFLNDAEANQANERGTNMFFDARGNVWFNPAMVPEAQEIFSSSSSRIVYNRRAPVGARYSVSATLSPTEDSYARHPVVGASWYGAVKYCNWLTLDTGRGGDERCYREGTNAVDWAPVTCPARNWADGVFTDTARAEWLAMKGYRLPMDNAAQMPPTPNPLFQVSNTDFVQFLNDSQANPDNARGWNMIFEHNGDVWFSPDMMRGKQELFSTSHSRILYSPSAPVGERYRVVRGLEPGVAYENIPVVNVSWAGALKYCNWLTMAKGLDASQCRYREGERWHDWAPTTCSPDSWRRGTFEGEELRLWKTFRGYHLPLLMNPTNGALSTADDTFIGTNEWYATTTSSGRAVTSWPNPFNEFYKAAAWGGATNAPYGFGRHLLSGTDANHLDAGLLQKHGTTPVGFFDGTDHQGRFPTSSNANYYGIYDISGNASEWMTDPGTIGSLRDRACYGGSWLFALSRVDQRFYVHPHFADNFRGIRLVSTHTDLPIFIVRAPYKICLCGYTRGTKKDERVGGGTFDYDQMPKDGQQLVISDGSQTWIFEFNDRNQNADTASGAVEVDITGVTDARIAYDLLLQNILASEIPSVTEVLNAHSDDENRGWFTVTAEPGVRLTMLDPDAVRALEEEEGARYLTVETERESGSVGGAVYQPPITIVPVEETIETATGAGVAGGGGGDIGPGTTTTTTTATTTTTTITTTTSTTTTTTASTTTTTASTTTTTTTSTTTTTDVVSASGL